MVEVLVALAVLTLVVYAIYEQFVSMSRQSQLRERAVVARWLAHQHLEELRTCDPAALAAWAGGEPWLDDDGFLCQQTAVVGLDGAIELTARVGWDNAGDHQEFAEGRTAVAKGWRVP